MRKGKFEFKSGRSLKGTPCIPMGTDDELKKIPEGALGYNPETGALSIKNATGLTPVGAGKPAMPEPPEPPQPDPNSLIFVITDANTVESEEPASVITVTVGVDWLDEDGFYASCVDEDTGTELEYGSDWDMDPKSGSGYTVGMNINENYRGPFRLTFRGNMQEVSYALISKTDGDSSTFIETVSFGGVKGLDFSAMLGVDARVMICGDENKISSWQGLHNVDGIVLGNFLAGDPLLLSIPDSLARLEHLKLFMCIADALQSGGLYGYAEFAKNKQYVIIQAPYWEGDASAMKMALENEGYVPPSVQSGETTPVFSNTYLADGFFDIPEPWARMGNPDTAHGYPASLMGLVYKKYGSLKGIWGGVAVDNFIYEEDDGPESLYMEIQAHTGAGDSLKVLDIICVKEEYVPGYQFWDDFYYPADFVPAVPTMRDYMNDALMMALLSGYGTTIVGHPQGDLYTKIYGHLTNAGARTGTNPIYVMHIPGGVVSGHDTAYDVYVQYNYATKKWEYLN